MLKTLNTKGYKCPFPVLKAKKEIKKLSKGDTLVVESTDPLSKLDFKFFCKNTGHKLTKIKKRKNIFIIEILVKR